MDAGVRDTVTPRHTDELTMVDPSLPATMGAGNPAAESGLNPSPTSAIDLEGMPNVLGHRPRRLHPIPSDELNKSFIPEMNVSAGDPKASSGSTLSPTTDSPSTVGHRTMGQQVKSPKMVVCIECHKHIRKVDREPHHFRHKNLKSI